MAPTTPKTPKKGTPAKRIATPTTPSSPSPRIRKCQREAPDLGTELVFILLGSGPKPTRKTFVMHKNLVMSSSGFFAMGLGSSFKEADTGVFELEEEDADVFCIFVHWVYFGRLFTIKSSVSSVTPTDDDHDDDDDDDAEDEEEWQSLPRLYTLGERLDSPRFKDAVISAMIEKVNESNIMPDNWASYVYQNTVTACSLRRLIVDFHVFAHQGKLLKRGNCPDAEEPEVEFLRDVVDRMADAGESVFAVAGTMPWVDDGCGYHEHGGESCHLLEDVAPALRELPRLSGSCDAPLTLTRRCTRRTPHAPLSLGSTNPIP